jgi:hypothetical protein
MGFARVGPLRAAARPPPELRNHGTCGGTTTARCASRGSHAPSGEGGCTRARGARARLPSPPAAGGHRDSPARRWYAPRAVASAGRLGEPRWGAVPAPVPGLPRSTTPRTPCIQDDFEVCNAARRSSGSPRELRGSPSHSVRGIHGSPRATVGRHPAFAGLRHVRFKAFAAARNTLVPQRVLEREGAAMLATIPATRRMPGDDLQLPGVSRGSHAPSATANPGVLAVNPRIDGRRCRPRNHPGCKAFSEWCLAVDPRREEARVGARAPPSAGR